jgi:hypothetical protein
MKVATCEGFLEDGSVLRPGDVRAFSVSTKERHGREKIK